MLFSQTIPRQMHYELTEGLFFSFFYGGGWDFTTVSSWACCTVVKACFGHLDESVAFIPLKLYTHCTVKCSVVMDRIWLWIKQDACASHTYLKHAQYVCKYEMSFKVSLPLETGISLRGSVVITLRAPAGIVLVCVTFNLQACKNCHFTYLWTILFIIQM